jgi:hypothetical protein
MKNYFIRFKKLAGCIKFLAKKIKQSLKEKIMLNKIDCTGTALNYAKWLETRTGNLDTKLEQASSQKSKSNALKILAEIAVDCVVIENMAQELLKVANRVNEVSREEFKNKIAATKCKIENIEFAISPNNEDSKIPLEVRRKIIDEKKHAGQFAKETAALMTKWVDEVKEAALSSNDINKKNSAEGMKKEEKPVVSKAMIGQVLLGKYRPISNAQSSLKKRNSISEDEKRAKCIVSQALLNGVKTGMTGCRPIFNNQDWKVIQNRLSIAEKQFQVLTPWLNKEKVTII